MNISESKLHKLQRKLKTRPVAARMRSEPRKEKQVCKCGWITCYGECIGSRKCQT